MTETQIVVALIVIGYLTIYAKSSFKTSYLEFPSKKSLESEISSYSFKHVRFGFDKNLTGLKKDLEDQENLEKILFKSLPYDIKFKARPYIKAILRISEIYQVDPIWIASVVWTESHFNAQAKSRVGALGLMQIMPTTRKYLYKKIKRNNGLLLVEKPSFSTEDFFDEAYSDLEKSSLIKSLVHIELGVFYLKRLLKRFDGNHKIATIAYNMGPSWTRRRLSRNQPVGQDNQYLTKVSKAYAFISKSI
jgi:soluble lytic murein transglycosylase